MQPCLINDACSTEPGHLTVSNLKSKEKSFQKGGNAIAEVSIKELKMQMTTCG